MSRFRRTLRTWKAQENVNQPAEMNDPTMTVRNVENLLTGILTDLDTILDAWENNPLGNRDYRNPATSKTAQNALRMDAEWLRAALGNKIFRLFVLSAENYAFHTALCKIKFFLF